MIYRAVGNRCAVDFVDLDLPIDVDQALVILKDKGFQNVEVNLVDLAYKLIGVAEYRRSARLSEAPFVVDCSSLIKGLYGQRGIWLPRRTIQQREQGKLVDPSEVSAEDIVFVSGLIDYYTDDPSDGVGHVGIATGNGTVIHAASKKLGVIESPFTDFIKKGLRGIRRMIPRDRRVYTFVTPTDREVEWSDDIRWIIYQNLK